MQEKSALVLDIGTASIKAGFLENTALQYYDGFAEFSGRSFEKEVIKKAVLRVLKEIQNKSGVGRNEVLMSLPPEALRAKFSFQSLEIRNPSGTIAQKEEEEIRRELSKKNRKEVGEGFFEEYGIAPQELDFSEENFLAIKIDGYPVPRLAGYRGKKVEAEIFSTFSPRNYLNIFRQLFEELDLGPLKIVYPGQNLPKLFKETGDVIFLDVGGRVTQIFIVKNGKLADIFDFSVGGDDFSKAISQTFGMSEEKARLFKESYARKEITEETRARVHQIFSGVAENWFFILKSKLGSFAGQIPSKVVIFGGGSKLPEIPEVLEKLTKENPPQTLKNPQLVNLALISYDR